MNFKKKVSSKIYPQIYIGGKTPDKNEQKPLDKPLWP